jgi:hypothetical protein
MNWQTEPTRPEGATKVAPFVGFEVYQTAPVQGGLESDEVAEGEGAPPGSSDTVKGTYES